RLAHQVFLLIMVVAAATTTVMALAMALNLRQGFQDYLLARDLADLKAYVSNLERRLSALPGPIRLADRPDLLRSLPGLDLPREDRPPPPRPIPGSPERLAPPMEFTARLVVLDDQGRMLLGPSGALGIADHALLPRAPIVVRGEQVGEARLILPPRLSTPADSGFLERQLRHMILAGALILGVGSLAAFWIARASGEGLREIRRVTDSIARGEFRTRLRERGPVEVAETLGNINRMAEELEAMDAARRRWLAEISHELRTPLTALRAEIEALQDGVLVDLLKEAADRFELLVRGAGLTLTIDVGGLQSAPCQGDRRALEQMIANLLTNSVKYTRPGGRILIALRRTEGQGFILTVDDTAPAPPRDALGRLFEPLYRVEPDRNRQAGGSGMGLAICEVIARAHDGAIRALASELGGLRVEVYLPDGAAA
ncbi:MAG: ATP-binding protein, partial [Phenylobacterium sp.]|nr:ATP-binding protein [Phenylobacterium sp.]